MEFYRNLTDWSSSNKAVDELFKLGWIPQSEKDLTHVLAAKRRGQELRILWEIAKSVSLKDIESGKYNTIINRKT